VARADEKVYRISDFCVAGFLLFDANGHILEANHNFLQMLKYGPENLAELKWEELTPQQYHALDRGQLREAQERGQSTPWRKEFLASDGERIPVLVQAACVEEHSGQFVSLVLNTSELERSEQDFRTLPGRLLNLYDDERRRIARELHDTTAQNLAALSMNLAMLAGALGDSERSRAILAECDSLTDECLKEVRSLSYMLHPPLLDELGLESALRAFIAMYERRTNVAVKLTLKNQIGRLRPEVELGVFRIAQESLFNVQRHSGSDTVEIQLARSGSMFEVSIRDWGKGVDSEVVRSKSLGIAGMRERVRLLGGELEIGPANPGAIVRARFPLER
jgi:PAS domain S-box-containing protein